MHSCSSSSGFVKLLKTITAFTVAHSVTLALATLGLVNVPPGPIEAIIALSIMFVAVEIVRKRGGHSELCRAEPDDSVPSAAVASSTVCYRFTGLVPVIPCEETRRFAKGVEPR